MQTKHRTLRDELRKLQSSVQLMEKSRNPGVGYWAQGGPHQASGSSSASASTSVSATGGSTPVPNGSGFTAPPDTPSKESRRESKKSLESVRTVGQESTVSAKEENEEEVNLEVGPVYSVDAFTAAS